jgi:hypothetical protein
MYIYPGKHGFAVPCFDEAISKADGPVPHYTHERAKSLQVGI